MIPDTPGSGVAGLLSAPRDRLERTAAAFSALESRWLLAAIAPVVLTAAVITAGYVASGGEDPGFPPQFATFVYGVSNVVVLGVLYARFPERVWRASALFRRPSKRELAAGVLATAAGVAVGWPLTTLLADAAGIARYTVPSVVAPFGFSPVGILALFFGSVVVAPVAEEILFRGLFLGVVLDRGYGPYAAAASSLAVFAALHAFTAGAAGVVNALLLGALLTWLRFRFDNLAGAWLLHALNNLLEFLVAISVFPSLYAL
ncbi:CPBP family intramembrane glutamic endopeptidase [Halorussus aquaticus]|uniref:CPBP family intramembrane glutamic endopeptidase n=1 Tax=Halorussus aquaticus TaxID=2953748 RepID=A0ABD5Q3J9_9EURY|nr:CPBP family intramembrane glutamic endopeptidase [Halorussus aquaticus]